MMEGRERNMHNPCVLSLAVTPGKFSSTAELLCCFDLMNIHYRAGRGRESGSWQHFGHVAAAARMKGV